MDLSHLHEVELLLGGTALPHRVREVERTAERARDRQRARRTNAIHLGQTPCQGEKRPGRGGRKGGGHFMSDQTPAWSLEPPKIYRNIYIYV